MKKVPENFCILPFIGIESTTLGKARVCCNNSDDLYHNREQLNFKKNSILEAFNSDSMNELRKKFLQNERPDGCKLCWDVEDAKGKSKRHLANEKFKVFVQKSDHSNPKLRFVDLKLGNICNLKCRICGFLNSSKWAGDELEIIHDQNKKDIIKKYNKMAQWPREAENFWTDIEVLVNDVYTLSFAGGEPLLIQEHFDFLNYCIVTNNSDRISIHYNTNGTQFPQHAIDNIWPRFKKVELAFSIDGLGPEFEYQREGANWEVVEKNIKKFNEISENTSWLTTQICTTVNNQNIMSIIELLQWAETINLEKVWINLLHHPKYFSIKHLPIESKINVKSYIESNLYKIKSVDLKNQLSSVVEFMMKDAEDLSEQMINELTKIDSIRKQNWRTALPKLAGLIDDK